MRSERRAERLLAKCDDHEWIGGDSKNDDLGDTGNVMIDEATAILLVHVGEDWAIEPLDQEALEDVEADEEEDDEDDRDDQGGEWGELGDLLERFLFQILASMASSQVDHDGRSVNVQSGQM